MERYRTNTTRLDMTVAELNAMAEAHEHPGTVVNMFIETTTPETFSSLYKQLLPRLQEYAVSSAKTNAANFDECIAYARKKGLYAEGWVAYRAWAHAQPWFPEALARAEHFKALEVPYDQELERQIKFMEGRLAEAKSDTERAWILDDIEGTRRDLERWRREEEND